VVNSTLEIDCCCPFFNCSRCCLNIGVRAPVVVPYFVVLSAVFYENEDLYGDGDCMRICIRNRVMRLMSDRAYAYAYGRLYIYGLWPSR